MSDTSVITVRRLKYFYQKLKGKIINSTQSDATDAFLAAAVGKNLQTQINGKLGKSENAASATKLATSRNVKLTGDVSGSASFNGTSDATVNTSVTGASNAVVNFTDKGSISGITSFSTFMTKFVTGNKLATTLMNLKAGLQYVLHVGTLVNNCVSDNTNLPLAAAQGKVLQDQINQLNGKLEHPTIVRNEDFNGFAKAAAVHMGYESSIGFFVIDLIFPDGTTSRLRWNSEKMEYQYGNEKGEWFHNWSK